MKAKLTIFMLIVLSVAINIPNASSPASISPGTLMQSLTPITFNMTKPFRPSGIYQVLEVPVVSTFSPNGTIQLQAGKSIFRISPPAISGVSISSFLTLWSNSSMIQYRYVNGPTSVTLNITRIQNSYGFGVSLVGKGIPVIGNTTISLNFNNVNTSPVVNDAFNVFFGQIGFDWSDTLGYLPVFSNSVLSWTISSNFIIDPGIVFVSATSGGYDSGQGLPTRIDMSITPTAGDTLVTLAGTDSGGIGSCLPTVSDNIDGTSGWVILSASNGGVLFFKETYHLNIPAGITTVTSGWSNTACNEVATVSEYSGVGSVGISGENDALPAVSNTPTVSCPTNCVGLNIGPNSWFAGGTLGARDTNGPTTTVGTRRVIALTPNLALISIVGADNTAGTLTWSWGTFKPGWVVIAIELKPAVVSPQKSFGEII